MKRIAVVTVGRSDYGIYRPVLAAMSRSSKLDFSLMVSGAHLAPEFGDSLEYIERDGYPIRDRLPMLLSSDTPGAVAVSMGLGTLAFAQAFDRERPDLLLVLGDRFEMFAAASAAVPFRIPIAHIHGGELTLGAIDDALRHALTKLSHLHFATTQIHANRIRQMGEEPWRITVCGAPALDLIRNQPVMPKEELEGTFGISFEVAPLLATFHPVTLEYDRTEDQVAAFLEAIETVGWPVVFTLPNADTNGRMIIRMIERFVAAKPHQRWIVSNFGSAYTSMMRWSAAMIGNSSSGLIEAGALGLPVVNVGNRQEGRVRGRNVIDTPDDADAIARSITTALSPEFRAGCSKAENPYDAGAPAGELITARLEETTIDQSLLIKRFQDYP